MNCARTAPLIAALVIVTALLAGCGGDDNGGGGSATATTNAEEGVQLQIVAENTKFDKSSLQVPAGAEVTVTMDNRDSLEHSFSLYPSADSNDPLFAGPRFEGPSFLTYEFTAPETPGTYQFRCDVHPQAMRGDFIVK
jgi:plastocyanin